MIIDSRYQVITNLGTGLYASVFKVRDIRTDQIYSLKLFNHLEAGAFYEELNAESMHHITKLRHPNLLHIYNFGNWDTHIYYLAEFYQGTNLKNFRFNSQKYSMLYDLIVQIVYALDALHNQNILHKDIKPENIMYSIVDQKIRIKVLDYGFNKMDTERNQQRISGTLPYIAPEIYAGESGSPESDFYALGVTLYYILTQTLPFSQDQISEIIQGEYKNFFPKFIRNFVPDIPIELEKFVLKLIEKKPEDRFPNCHAIIQYINKIQKKRYVYTQKQATINFFKYGSYLVRNEYSNQLKGFVENIVQKNGKLITIIGGEGLGKGDILTLFKYSILNNNYYIFDYVCSTQNRDPLFALIKEFSSSALSNERKQIESSLISEKLKIYLEKSEIEAAKLNETKDNLEQDFEYSKQFLMNLSDEKPLIFIIRNGQHLTEHTLDFLNHIAPEINNLPVMIIVSINDPEKIKKLKYAVRIMMKTLTPTDTHDYLQKILRSDVTQEFSQELWERTNGNPQFIVGILSDLIENKKLITDDKIHFDIDLAKYQLPEKIIHSIYKRMSHLSAVSYRYLQKLSCIHTPLNMELIMEMLQISKRTLYNLLSDAISNEILYKEGGVYKFNFREVKERFFNECPDFIKVDISNKLIEYHKSSANLDKETIKGLLLNCLITKDYESLLLFKRQLYKLYNSDYEQHNAFNEIYEILELTLSDKAPLRESDFRADLLSLICKAELTGSIEKAYNLVSSIKNKDNIFEYHFVLAALNMRLESFEKALELYQKSYNLAISGKQQTIALLDMVWIHIFKGEKAQAQSIIEQLSQYQLTNDLEVCFNDRKGLFISKFHNEEDAIEFLEEYLPKIQATNDQRIINRLSSLYSNLGNLYSNTKRYTEASKYYKLAQSLSEKINNQNQLSAIYSNIGDFYLKQGMTNNALDYFNKGKNLSKKLNNIRNLTLANVNFGEAYIKLGDFVSAETYLEKARELSENSKNKNFYDSIMSNLATTKNKLYGFKEYLDFIEKEHLFELYNTKKSITPFHKTYIYYLCEVMQIEKVSEFLNANLKPSNTNDDEFLYQVKGIINLHKKEYQLAKTNFEKSLTAANQIKSIYALTICYIRLAECNIKMNNINEAEENIKNAKVFVETHQFKYWGTVIQILKLQIALLRKETPLRSLLRQTIILNEKCEENRYHILNIDCLGLITQIYKELKATSLYKSSFNKYMTKVKDIARGIPDNEYKSYIAYRLPVQTPQQHLQLYQVTPRAKKDHESWQKELFALLRKDVVNEIHYVLEKFIKDNFAPQKYTIIYSKKSISYDKFLSHTNFATYVSSGIKETELEAYQQTCINALNKRAVEKDVIEGKHVMVAPLWLRKSCYGCLIIEDNGELAFTNHETHTMEMFSIQLSALLIRVLEYENNEKTIKKMQEVMNLSKRFIQVHDVKRLEVSILINAISLSNAKRGVLIKKDSAGNFLFQIAYDSDRNIISSFPNISKTTLLYVEENRRPLYTSNILEDIIFKTSPSILQYQINSLFCAPIIIENKIYAYLYLDNYQRSHEHMFVDEEVNNMFIMQAAMALKNALGYERLMKKNNELKTLDNMKNEFIAIVSHELNTPLTTMQSNLTRLKKNKEAFTMDTNELIKKVEKSTNKLRQSINDIITLNRYNGIKELPLEMHNLEDLLSTIVTEAELTSKHRRMNFRFETGEALPLVMVDWQSFHLMVYNIVQNAIRFTSDFGTIIVGIRNAVFQKEKVGDLDSVVIYIQDNGIGIPEYEQENVFKSFYELGDMLAHRSGDLEYRSSGLGLGLAISKRISELHNGKIWLRSQESEGTTVFISIPVNHEPKDIIAESSEITSMTEME